MLLRAVIMLLRAVIMLLRAVIMRRRRRRPRLLRRRGMRPRRRSRLGRVACRPPLALLAQVLLFEAVHEQAHHVAQRAAVDQRPQELQTSGRAPEGEQPAQRAVRGRSLPLGRRARHVAQQGAHGAAQRRTSHLVVVSSPGAMRAAALARSGAQAVFRRASKRPREEAMATGAVGRAAALEHRCGKRAHQRQPAQRAQPLEVGRERVGTPCRGPGLRGGRGGRGGCCGGCCGASSSCCGHSCCCCCHGAIIASCIAHSDEKVEPGTRQWP